MTILFDLDTYTGTKIIDFKITTQLTKLFINDKTLSEETNVDCAMDFEGGLLCYYVTKDDKNITIHLLDYVTTVF